MTALGDELPVLCVFTHAPTALTSGASIRRRRLAQQISPLGPSLAVVLQPMDEGARSGLEAELGVPVVAVDVPRRGRLRAFVHWLGHPSVPWGIARIDTAVARRLIVDQLGGVEPAIVWCAGLEAWRSLPGDFRRRAVVDVVDLPSRYSRELALVAVRRRVRRAVHDTGRDPSLLVTARDVLFHIDGTVRYRWLERIAGRRSRAVVVANPLEARGRQGIRCIPDGFDDPGVVDPRGDPHAPTRFVFAGSFHNPPNRDGAEWFAGHVLGPLDRLVPTARFVFAGSCPDDFHEFGMRNGVEVTGYLPDLSVVFDAATVAIVPVRVGSGTRIKVIEAWARGVPVVSTSKGVEGLDAVDGGDVMVADDPAEFAAACSRVARTPELRRQLARRGRSRYEDEFTWDRIGEVLRSWLVPAAG